MSSATLTEVFSRFAGFAAPYSVIFRLISLLSRSHIEPEVKTSKMGNFRDCALQYVLSEEEVKMKEAVAKAAEGASFSVAGFLICAHHR